MKYEIVYSVEKLVSVEFEAENETEMCKKALEICSSDGNSLSFCGCVIRGFDKDGFVCDYRYFPSTNDLDCGE